MIKEFIIFILEIDKYLSIIVQNYGLLAYLFVFAIIFCETGLVIAPILPGDSLIFAAGALSGIGLLNIFVLFFLLFLAAVVGDSLNYFIGNYIGKRAFTQESRFFKKEYLYRTEDFYEKYGGKAVVLGRFVPIIRTFVPFVAGIGAMNYSRFLFYNILGGFLWVSLFLFSGYFLGTLPFVKDNFSIFIIVIIIVSVLPLFYEIIKNRLKKQFP